MIGGETIRSIPLQRTAFLQRLTHDNEGNRLIPLLVANQGYDWALIETVGNADLEIFNLSDVAGTIYIFFGADPTRVLVEAAVNAWGFYNYIALNREQTYRAPCRGRYTAVFYQNGGVDQAVWEFSIQIKPVGRS